MILSWSSRLTDPWYSLNTLKTLLNKSLIVLKIRLVVDMFTYLLLVAVNCVLRYSSRQMEIECIELQNCTNIVSVLTLSCLFYITFQDIFGFT